MAKIFGDSIRATRLEKNMTMNELASRAGVSRNLIARIEKGDPGCSLGAYFEVCMLLGLALFEPDLEGLRKLGRSTQEKLDLLPKRVKKQKAPLNDNF